MFFLYNNIKIFSRNKFRKAKKFIVNKNENAILYFFEVNIMSYIH